MKQSEIVKQHDLKDCGVCCLLSIIKYYGGYIPLEKLRIDTHTSLEGTTAYNIIETAKNYGFDSYGLYLEEKSLNDLILPAIAHVTINHLLHFVVIYKINKNNVEIMDPAKGKVKMALNDFKEIWTGNIILFYPKYSLPKTIPKDFFKVFSFQILKLEKKQIVSIIILTAIFTFLTIITSFYLKVGVNLLNEINDFSVLYYVSISFLVLIFIKIIIYYLKNFFKTLLDRKSVV